MRLVRSSVDYPHHGQPWRHAELSSLIAACQTPRTAYAIADQLSRVLGRTAESIRTKITDLKLHRGRLSGRPKRPVAMTRLYREPDSDPIEVKDGRPVDDGRFVEAMLREIKNKTENPPIGVDGRPCTKAPIYVDRGDPHGVLAIR